MRKSIYRRQNLLLCILIIIDLFFIGCVPPHRTAITTLTGNPSSSTITVEKFPGVIGWEADKDGVIAYIDGSFLVRAGKNVRYQFGVFQDVDSLDWYNAEGYLPCLVTEFERETATVKIMNFGDKVTINGKDYVVIYSRVSITNNGSSDITLDPLPSEGLIILTSNPAIVKPRETINHDYVVAADRFGNDYAWPLNAELAAEGSWESHYAHMRDYWNSRLQGIVNITRLPDARLIDAYKAGFIYTHIIRDGNDLHVGENGYDAVFDHDSVGILTTLFALGDFTFARPLLNALQSQTQYSDAMYKNSWVWAMYLLKTDDTSFVQDHFGKIVQNTHRIEADRTGPNGILGMTNDIDANGFWTVDDASALFGLTTYNYLAERLGYPIEAAWASNLYSSLLGDVNQILQNTQDSAGFSYLPCDLSQKNTLNRCNDPLDANWASMLLFGRWYWEGYLWGAKQNGLMLDSIDPTYAYGFQRMQNILPTHTYGGYPGFSTGYNAGYGISGLRGTEFRSEAIRDYQFMLDYTQSSPFGWWENIQDTGSSIWEGSHPSGGGGACPHMWGQSFATTGLLDSLIVEKYDGTVLVGRGVPNDWVAEGQVIELSKFPISGNKRMGILIEGLPGNQIRFTLYGQIPEDQVVFNLPALIHNIKSATAGTINNAEGTVTIEPGINTLTVILESLPASD